MNTEAQKQKYDEYICESILQPLLENKINVYELLNSFVSFVLATKPDSPLDLSVYLVAIRSYLAFYDIDVMPSKFRRKVKVPKLYKENEEPIDASDIRKLLLNCNNRRLKSYLLVLVSGAMREQISEVAFQEQISISSRCLSFTSSSYNTCPQQKI